MQPISTHVVSSFSVHDLQTAKKFYEQVLGLEVSEDPMGILDLKFGNGGAGWIYPKPDHQPATYTVLNFPVADVEATVDSLRSKGVVFEQYHNDYFQTDEKGIVHGGPDYPTIAWFKDPSGNILSVVNEKQPAR